MCHALSSCVLFYILRPCCRRRSSPTQRRVPSAAGNRAGEPSGRPLARANTDLYYANGGHEDEDGYAERVPLSPRHGATAGAGGANGHAAGGWADASGGGAARPPRGKPSPRLSPRQGDSDAHFTEASVPPLRRGINEVSESEAGALSGSGQRPATLYAGPADRSNQAAAGYLRNQGFSFPTMLASGASPGQSQLLSGAPRVRARLEGGAGSVWLGRAGLLAAAAAAAASCLA